MRLCGKVIGRYGWRLHHDRATRAPGLLGAGSIMARLGIELGARTLRGVRLEGWYRTRARTVEIEWDREHPAEAVAALRQHFGPARRIALALDLPLLFTKQVQLPALGPAGKRSILRLEPERFFPVRGEDIVPAVRGGGKRSGEGRGGEEGRVRGAAYHL